MSLSNDEVDDLMKHYDDVDSISELQDKVKEDMKEAVINESQ
jgi:hypothetical protein